MRKLLAAAILLGGASLTSIAAAQMMQPMDPAAVPAQHTRMDAATPSSPVPDARSLASDRDVGEARRAYRAACDRVESTAFCECVTAGVAQALMPEEVRIAARTLGERLPAQGDAAIAAESDAVPTGASSLVRIEQVEGHYADACAQYRG
ncbi:MAG: hypothetical protein AB7O98_18165 [Hyphomonadaceae bacterium]